MIKKNSNIKFLNFCSNKNYFSKKILKIENLKKKYNKKLNILEKNKYNKKYVSIFLYFVRIRGGTLSLLEKLKLTLLDFFYELLLSRLW